jgi:acyl-phosphate glycerol 3-phosphate acyltransferase
MSLSLIALIAYLIGSIPFAFIINKLFFHQDPRETGSGNIGALNTLRIGLKKGNKISAVLAFIAVFFLDGLKGAVMLWLAQNFLTLPDYQPDTLIVLGTAALFVVLGHNYSLYLKFQGGRGAATFMGMLIYLDWRLFLVWGIATLLGMIIAEILSGHAWNKKLIKNAFNNQMIGRLGGEVLGLILIYCFNRKIFFILALPQLFILIAHKTRLQEQIKNIKNKTYLKK